MVTVDGTSKITFYKETYIKLISSILGENNRDSCNLLIKLDSRANVRSSYGKFIADSNNPEVRIYTGAIVATWEDIFTANEGLTNELDVLLFTTVFLLSKYSAGVTFDLKTSLLDPSKGAPLKEEVDYQDILRSFSTIKNFYNVNSSSKLHLNIGVLPEEEIDEEETFNMQEFNRERNPVNTITNDSNISNNSNDNYNEDLYCFQSSFNLDLEGNVINDEVSSEEFDRIDLLQEQDNEEQDNEEQDNEEQDNEKQDNENEVVEENNSEEEEEID